MPPTPICSATRWRRRASSDLLKTRIAGTPQLVEQADDNEKRTAAQLLLNKAQLDQQKALLASLDVQGQQLEAQVRAAEAQVTLARNNLDYTRIVSPADGMVGQRQVRPGQFVNVGTQVIARGPAAEYLGDRQLQGDADDRTCGSAIPRVSPSMRFPTWC